ncbi:hypothetical protein CYMTET_23064 [Cymbomonas tetramitiformis]|uniref:Uncharacterized protein n=1 Tax=Cymbomonas tetramitiformis TaxID=36881 RepID=A0AAE0FYY5_9CHLO|nr:hypothetical protein CYMTET_23064 [Cymbomonas tetramitiformis]
MVEMVRELVEKSAEVDTEDGKGRTALTVALAFGQEAAARALLEAGAGVNAGTGQRPLHGAAEGGMVEMLRELVDKGADVDAEDGEGHTALTVALAGGQEAAARALLEAGAGVNAGTGRRPLHAAAERGTVELVRELLEKSAEVDAEDREGRTALTVALAFGQEAAARALLEAGAGVNAGTGRRPLHAAAERGTVELEAAARALLEAGAGVNAGTGRRPLHAAAEKGMVEMVRDLVDKGAEVDAEDGEGHTALTQALAGGKEAAARALLEAGAGVDAGTGQRPLHAAAMKGTVEMVRELVEKGAEVDAEDREGCTALTVALAFGQEAAARALLEAGAGVNAGTGRRPLHTAAEKGMVEMVRELVEKSAEVDAEDREGCTALTVALAYGQEAAARALLEAGAGVNAGTGRRPLHTAAEKGMVEMWAEASGQCFSAEILQLVQK